MNKNRGKINGFEARFMFCSQVHLEEVCWESAFWEFKLCCSSLNIADREEPESGELCDKPRAEERGSGSVEDWL